MIREGTFSCTLYKFPLILPDSQSLDFRGSSNRNCSLWARLPGGSPQLGDATGHGLGLAAFGSFRRVLQTGLLCSLPKKKKKKKKTKTKTKTKDERRELSTCTVFREESLLSPARTNPGRKATSTPTLVNSLKKAIHIGTEDHIRLRNRVALEEIGECSEEESGGKLKGKGVPVGREMRFKKGAFLQLNPYLSSDRTGWAAGVESPRVIGSYLSGAPKGQKSDKFGLGPALLSPYP
ncbi:hypothetical protein B296_00042012 [Ensete ventricosum]|uniref:Uncharacterized protein n=1 Tax=Ensete ventricosum TaxID=4639 RepID=A0A426Z8E7_ENSVE|nr:hypothetical protein B296_00042012 [Ensete ventricosum]